MALTYKITGLSIIYSNVCLGEYHSNIKTFLRVFSPMTGEFPAQEASNAENVPDDDAIIITKQYIKNVLIQNDKISIKCVL